MSGRTIIVGDIHGCLQTFDALMSRVSLNTSSDHLILLGDLMDRGPDSFGVWQRAVSLQQEMRNRFTLIEGSHEEMLLREPKLFKDYLLWRIIGKQATERSFHAAGAQLSDAVPWFKAHCTLGFESQNFQCVHAGIREESIQKNSRKTLLLDHQIAKRNLYQSRLTIIGHIHLHKATWFAGPSRGIHLLTYHQWQELPKTGVICLDTSCAEGNMLTAMMIQDEMFFLEYEESKEHIRP